MYTNCTDMQRSLRLNPVGAVTYVTVYMLISIAAAISNSMVILSFWRYKYVRSVVNNHFLVALAVVDLMISLIAVPLAVFNRLVESEFTCHITTHHLLFTPAYVAGSATISHVMALTVDRYIAITRPLRYTIVVTPNRVFRTCLCLWCFSIVFALLPGLQVGHGHCHCVCIDRQTGLCKNLQLTLYVLAAVIVVPLMLLAMCLIYVRIFYVAFLQQQVPGLPERKGRLNATISASVLLVLHTLCWLPVSFKYIYEYFIGDDKKTVLVVQIFCELIAYSNSFTNPIIYTWRNAHFRRAFRDTIQKMHCWYSVDEEASQKPPSITMEQLN